jgi:drug/metabolite transporter (DMT)-like permease
MGALVALPFALWVGLPSPAAWPFIAASLVIHIGYYIALAGAYQHGELGLTYPIMRGFAPLLVALGSAAVVGEVPSASAWLGIVGITAGVALVGLAHPATGAAPWQGAGLRLCQRRHHRGLHLRRRLGVRTETGGGGQTLRYVLWLFVLDGLPYPLLVWLRRGPEGRRAIIDYARQRWPLAALGGTASIGSYAIALWAMTRAPVASVAALRETSVLFATVIGTLVLKEKFGLQRALGTVVIVAGVIALRFG